MREVWENGYYNDKFKDEMILLRDYESFGIEGILVSRFFWRIFIGERISGMKL